jgi:hypothetical protein
MQSPQPWLDQSKSLYANAIYQPATTTGFHFVNAPAQTISYSGSNLVNMVNTATGDRVS